MGRYDEPMNRHERFEVWLTWCILSPWERVGLGFGAVLSALILASVAAAVVAEYV